MKKILYLILPLVAFISCNSNGNGNENERIVAESSGNINNLNVIIDNELWQGQIGETIREHLAAPVDGLPQDNEPIFSISQMPPEAFEGFARRNRIFLKIEKGDSAGIKKGLDTYARPQTGIVVTGETNEEIANIIEENADEIISTFRSTEIKERQRRSSKSLLDDSRLEEELGVSLKIPSAYRYAKDENGFFWIRKEISNGSMEILAYEVPINQIQKDSNIIGNIIEMRDSIGERHIPGPVEGTHMITEAAYAPYLYESQIDGKFAYETRGTWEVNGNVFMAGPFINYAILDEENDRFLVLEGFTFAPSAPKRDNMFELEAIIRSAEIE